jgi:antitoxin component YwqK of YwqJK toxin-antitoxin module
MLESEWGEFSSKKGKWVRYFENGQIETVTIYDEKGELNGEHLQYYENGNKKRIVVYDHGKEVSDEFWFENGKQLSK